MAMKHNNYINVPTLFTALNLFCGFLSVIQTSNNNFVNAAWLIFIAAVFDALDGRIARASGRTSEFGLQMDSLCDVVSSGLAPSILVYGFYLHNLGQIGLVISFLPLLFAAFRLARFNIFASQSGKKSGFFGMPAPMAAVTLASVVILYLHTEWHFMLRLLLLMVPVVSLLMASTIKFDGIPKFSLKNKGKSRVQLVVFSTTFILLFVIPEYALFSFMMLYLISTVILAMIQALKNEDLASESEVQK